MSDRRIVPADLRANVRALTIAKAGLNKFDELRLYFDELPGVYLQPNETGVTTLTEFLGVPGSKWRGRRVVLAIVQAKNPETEKTGPVVQVGMSRQWYDLLSIQLPAL